MGKFQAVEIDERLASLTQNMISGRPDIFDSVFTGDDMRKVFKYAIDHKSTGVRLTGERQFIARGWNELVAVWNSGATDEQQAKAAVNKWYADVDAEENW